MPNYIYRCDFCTAEIEVTQHMDDSSRRKKCPYCRRWKLQRVPQLIFFKLKGSGFHVNDYGKYGPK